MCRTWLSVNLVKAALPMTWLHLLMSAMNVSFTAYKHFFWGYCKNSQVQTIKQTLADLEGVQGVRSNSPLDPNYFIFMEFQEICLKLGKRISLFYV